MIILLISLQCTSVHTYNAHLNDLIPTEKLQADVDWTYKKLQKLHPRLYWYISKEQLDIKFDSLKKSIVTPLNSFEFYKKISPVVANVRQGHLFIAPPMKMMTKKEVKAFVKKGTGPLSQFDFESFDSKLYIVKNKSYQKDLKVGSEVVSINGKNPSDGMMEYNKWFASDGFNTTFKKQYLGKKFPVFYSFENGVKDSLTYVLKSNDTLKTICIKRKVVDSIASSKDKNKATPPLAKAKLKELKNRKEKFGYDENTKYYNRSLTFREKDSAVAVLKIRGFTQGTYQEFYEESFEKIAKYKSKVLILDIRDNGGGRLNEIENLYSYLADSTYIFMDKSEVTSKTSMLHSDFLKGGGIVSKTAKLFFSPIIYGYYYFSTQKATDGKYYISILTKPKTCSPNAFKGKIYVLINGGSFSASSIISSNLKKIKRVTFIGEETGGAFNGTVAGSLPVYKMPHSKINVRIGLMTCIPFNKTTVEGRGIMPDIPISPKLSDRINNFDPEMNWAIEDFKKDVQVEQLIQNQRAK